MSDRKCWLAISVLATLMVLALSWPAWAQERNQLTFCDTADEITAVAIYGGDALPIINAKIPQACNTFIGGYVRGKTVETVRAFGKLWDITPVLVYAVGMNMQRVQPVEQWVALTSPLTEVTWRPEFGESPKEWIQWFNNAKTTPEARKRLNWLSCCDHSDRFITTFTQDATGEHWLYKRDEKWVTIPDDTVEPDDEKMPEQLKREGVLFIFNGLVTCFWPPQTTF